MIRFALAIMLFVPTLTLAQIGPVIPKAQKLGWEDPNPAGVVKSFNIYCAPAPAIQIMPSTLKGTLPGDARLWVIDLDVGQWHCVATAHDGTVESGGSNEVPFYIFSPPTQLEVIGRLENSWSDPYSDLVGAVPEVSTGE